MNIKNVVYCGVLICAQLIQLGCSTTNGVKSANAAEDLANRNSLNPAGFVETWPKYMYVHSNEKWHDVEIKQTSDDEIWVGVLEGKWRCNPGHRKMYDGRGHQSYKARKGYNMPGQKEGALVGNVGTNLYLIGNKASIALVSNVTGTVLRLACNDDMERAYGRGHSDNEGQLYVVVGLEEDDLLDPSPFIMVESCTDPLPSVQKCVQLRNIHPMKNIMVDVQYSNAQRAANYLVLANGGIFSFPDPGPTVTWKISGIKFYQWRSVNRGETNVSAKAEALD